MLNNSYVSMDQNTFNPSMKEFEGENLKIQFFILGLRINLNICDWKLAI